MALTYPRMRQPIEQRFPRPSVMGVVNVTPDSFSDAGVNFDPDDAVASARRMLAEGAAIVDVGGESTRPGAEAVSVDEELRRVVPVLEQLSGAPVSIDTSKAEVARRALELGAELVNDVTALRGDPALAEVVAESGAYLCLMHMQGEPRTMQADPRYDDVVSEVAAFLEERLRAAVAAGIAEERICLDPGIGFGKTVEHNFELVRRLDELTALGRPWCRLLAQELARQAARRPAGDDRLGRGERRRCGCGLRARSDDPARPRRSRARRGAGGGAGRAGMSVLVELRGLELPGRHGVLERERETEQPFLYDLELELPEPGADELEETVDYREVVGLVRELSDGRQFQLLESLAAAVADALLERFGQVERVRVRVRKPEVDPGRAGRLRRR